MLEVWIYAFVDVVMIEITRLLPAMRSTEYSVTSD